MNEYLSVLLETLAFLALGVPGYILGKFNLIEKSASKSLANILIYVSIPFLVLKTFMSTDVTTLSLTGIIVSVLAPFVTVYIAGLLGGKVFKSSLDKENAICSAFSNCGLMGIPISVALFPNNPNVTLYLSIYNVFSSFIMFTMGRQFLSGKKERKAILKGFLTPVTIALILGVIISLCKVNLLETRVYNCVEILALSSAPLSVTLLGFIFSKVKIGEFIKKLSVYYVALIKLIVTPLLTIITLFLLKLLGFEISLSLALGVSLAVAVPTAATVPALVDLHGKNGNYATALTAVNTVLSVITLPLIIYLTQIIF